MNAYTMVDALKNAYWQTLDVGDADSSHDQGSVVAASSSGGLWSVTTTPSGVLAPRWQFNVTLPTISYACFLRFTEFTHPAAADDIFLAFGLSWNPGLVYIGAAYQYPTGTANLNGGVYDEDGAGFTGTGAVVAANVTQVGCAAMHLPNGAAGFATVYSPAAATCSGAQTAGGGAATGIAIMLDHPAGAQQTYGFRPEYALIDLTQF